MAKKQPDPTPDTPTPAAGEALDKILLLILSGLPKESVLTAAQAKLGMTPQAAEAAYDEARRRITLAADFNRVAEIGLAVARLNDLYGRSFRAADFKVALATQRELNKLLDLYAREAAATGTKAAGGEAGNNDAEALRAELDAIRAHLLPLELAAETYPLREHARLAAEIVRENRD